MSNAGIIGGWHLSEGAVGRKVPGVVRREEAVCRTHDRLVHHVPGLAAGVIAAITVAEHGPLSPGLVARELRRWQDLARHGAVWRRASNPCGVLECCGPGPHGLLEEAIGYLPRRAKPGLRRVVWRADAEYPGQTLPDPLADPGLPWWERRRPVGWAVTGGKVTCAWQTQNASGRFRILSNYAQGCQTLSPG